MNINTAAYDPDFDVKETLTRTERGRAPGIRRDAQDFDRFRARVLVGRVETEVSRAKVAC